MSQMVPLYGFGASGGTGGTLTVTTPGAGITVTVSKDGKSKTKVSGADGVVAFKGLEAGAWTVTMTDGSQTATKTATITVEYAVFLTFSTIPYFTYTGDYEIVNDSDKPITTSQDNWKIRFLTSGTLTITSLNGAENGIDVFLVGGGGSGMNPWSTSDAIPGGGGGGGYTNTGLGLNVGVGTQYVIDIGAGGSTASGSVGNAGGTTSAFGLSASGGSGGSSNTGGKGGSGGGNGFSSDGGGSGGSDGNSAGGEGQGSTTREFGESEGKLYAGGGGGGSTWNANKMYTGGKGGSGGGGNGYALDQMSTPGVDNTGGGGGGSRAYTANGAKSGGSGIVIIRNARGGVS